MNQPSRRQVLSLSMTALSASLVGCTQGNLEGGSETETPPTEYTESGCTSMCEGTQIIEVDVRSGFSGTAELEASCRDDAVTIQSGESIQIVREEDAAACGVTLFIDGEQVYDERIDGHASVTVTVRSDGEIDEEGVMV